MEKKTYIIPQMDVMDIQLCCNVLFLSGGDQTGAPVGNPNDEVDAGDAL